MFDYTKLNISNIGFLRITINDSKYNNDLLNIINHFKSEKGIIYYFGDILNIDIPKNFIILLNFSKTKIEKVINCQKANFIVKKENEIFKSNLKFLNDNKKLFTINIHFSYHM